MFGANYLAEAFQNGIFLAELERLFQKVIRLTIQFEANRRLSFMAIRLLEDSWRKDGSTTYICRRGNSVANRIAGYIG